MIDVTTFIKTVEALTEVVYLDITDHPGKHRAETNEAIGIAYQQAVKAFKAMEGLK